MKKQRAGVPCVFQEIGRAYLKGFSINKEPDVLRGGVRFSSNPCGSILQELERFCGRSVFGVGIKFRETYRGTSCTSKRIGIDPCAFLIFEKDNDRILPPFSLSKKTPDRPDSRVFVE